MLLQKIWVIFKVFILYGVICSAIYFIISILHWALFRILNYMDIVDKRSENRIVPTIGRLGVG